jgi:SWI/SNF-related matrix-associated actin-dependent regulator 1 of chromatin subfamily A
MGKMRNKRLFKLGNIKMYFNQFYAKKKKKGPKGPGSKEKKELIRKLGLLEEHFIVNQTPLDKLDISLIEAITYEKNIIGKERLSWARNFCNKHAQLIKIEEVRIKRLLRYKIRIQVKNNQLLCKILFPTWHKITWNKAIDIFKTCGKSKYDSKSNTWHMPLTIDNIKSLSEAGITLPNKANTFMAQLSSKTIYRKNYKPSLLLKKDLYPFQKEGTSFIKSLGFNGVIGDEPGLGKTAQSLACLADLHHNKKAFPAIVICPASIKLQWQEEINAWLDIDKLRTTVLYGKNPKPHLIQESDIYIINFDIIFYWRNLLKKIKPQTVIPDELHKISNPTAQRTKGSLTLCNTAENNIWLSGTLFGGNVERLWILIKHFLPRAYSGVGRFRQRYMNIEFNPHTRRMHYSGAKNTQELYKLLNNNIMIRRKMSDVIEELPDSNHIIVPMETIHQEKVKKETTKLLKRTKSANTKIEAIADITNFMKYIATEKIQACILWIKDFLESGQKLIAFTYNRVITETIYNEFKSQAVLIYGSTPAAQRERAKNAFNENPNTRLLVANYKSAGEGLNLQHACHNAAFVQLPTTPDVMIQCERRIHRMMQKSNKVNFWMLVAKNSLDYEYAKKLDERMKIFSSILDNEDVPKDRNLLWDMINEIAN